MTNRRNVLFNAVVGLAGALMVTPGRAEAAEASISEAEALQALDPWADALFSGDREAVDKVLAPEFQILRSNGTGYKKEEYLTVLPHQKARSKFSDIVATGRGDILVVRYKADTDQTIEDVPVIGISPRISVFRKENERWLMVSHANFAHSPKPLCATCSPHPVLSQSQVVLDRAGDVDVAGTKTTNGTKFALHRSGGTFMMART